jgi:hypothetical protein
MLQIYSEGGKHLMDRTHKERPKSGKHGKQVGPILPYRSVRVASVDSRRHAPPGAGRTISKIAEAAHNIPASLYRYFSLSDHRMKWMEQLIVNNRIYFPSSADFNDPLDCRIPPSFNGSSLKVETWWRRFVKEAFPSESLHDHRSRIKEMVARSHTESGRQRMIDSTFRTLSRQGILSLSEKADSMLMWSYYANGHRGIAVRFDMDFTMLADSLPDYFFPIKVRYSHDFPDLEFYDTSNDDRVRTLIGTKSKEWEHEREWRIVARETTGYVTFKPESIIGIILGMRTSEDDEREIRKYVGTRPMRLDILRIRHKPKSFDLEVVNA